MASIKVKFRASTNDDKEGVVYFQVIHERVVRQIKTQYKLHTTEWNNTRSKVIAETQEHSRKSYLQRINFHIRFGYNRLLRIVEVLDSKGNEYDIDKIVDIFEQRAKGTTLFNFMLEQGGRLYDLHRYRAAESYKTTLNSFMRFRKGMDISLSEIDMDIMQEYEAWLKFSGKALSPTS